MAGHQPVRGFGVQMLLPAFGQHEFFALFQHRELANLREIAGQIGIANNARQVSYGHIVPLWCPSGHHRTAQSPSHYDCRRAADESLHGYEATEWMLDGLTLPAFQDARAR